MKRTTYLLVILLFLSLFLRIYRIADIPPATYLDEMDNAFNAHSLLLTGKDAHGIPWPLQFQSLGDYKPPLPVYLLVPSIKLFGLNTFAIRLPSSLLSAVGVVGVFLLVRRLLGEKAGLLSAALITISAWHLHMSRGLLEGTMALSFLVYGVFFYISADKNPKRLIVSALLLCLPPYTYFSYRIMMPLFILFLFWWGREWVFKTRRYALYFITLILVLWLPIVYMTVFNRGFSRMNIAFEERGQKITENVNLARTQIYAAPSWVKYAFHNKAVYWARDVATAYVDTLSPGFLYLFGDNSIRYYLGGMGVLYLIELPFMVVGVFKAYGTHRKIFTLLVGWLLTAPIPTALAGHPFPLRSLAMLPPLLIFTVLGINAFLEWARSINLLRPIGVGVVTVGFTLSFGYYLTRYFLEYPFAAASLWDWETEQAVRLAISEKDRYDRIYITNAYFDADLTLAYQLAMHPDELKQMRESPIFIDSNHFYVYHKFFIGSLNIKNANDLQKLPPRTLYIGREDEYDSGEMIKHPGDGRVVLKIHRRD
ncbi:glycosyltransferase family 39 protein [Candidatus Gottesmanbacteria bacterium]|nr:glycosyltransferase family 39 protein [Candidatus Gottesmanbacteria bacterium]